jgi:SAM-dependent methyltransferase
MSSTSSTSTPVSPEALDAFLGRFVGDFGAALAGANVIIGDRLGLYRALWAAGPAPAAAGAAEAGCDERHVREWLLGQAAGGYVSYDDATDRFSLTPEQAACLADEGSPTFLPGAFQIAASLYKDEDRLMDAVRTGAGMAWHEHHHDLFEGTDRFFRPGYTANLVDSWIPALEGVESKLRSGATVADVGCGLGSSTIIMAKAFPKSNFVGFDYHDESIQGARKAAESAGVADRVRFEVASAQQFPGDGYDLVCMFDCLHDMGDPVGAAAHVRQAMAEDGTWLVVEPAATDSVRENLNPVGRVFYNASTLVCTPASKAQEVGLALGAQAGPERLRQVITEGGFGRFRVATTTPFNLVIEAKP